MRADPPVSVVAFTSAPLVMSVRTMVRWPAELAITNGVQPAFQNKKIRNENKMNDKNVT
jgi:hypothetical protein